MIAINPTKYLKLPFQFGEEKLVRDLERVMTSKWLPHFNQQGYSGNWNALPLYAPGGEPDNIYALDHKGRKLEATPQLKACPYFRSVISNFKCSLSSVRLLRLAPGSYIKPHRDLEAGYENGFFRLHIPILTHAQVNFTLDGQRLIMRPGECWYTNVNYVHSVANEGSSDRVHLVLDGQRNEWSDQLFFSLAPQESFLRAAEPAPDSDTIQLMISELERQDTPAAKDLIRALQQQLQ